MSVPLNHLPHREFSSEGTLQTPITRAEADTANPNTSMTEGDNADIKRDDGKRNERTNTAAKFQVWLNSCFSEKFPEGKKAAITFRETM